MNSCPLQRLVAAMIQENEPAAVTVTTHRAIPAVLQLSRMDHHG
jgi:hypothetical protein